MRNARWNQDLPQSREECQPFFVLKPGQPTNQFTALIFFGEGGDGLLRFHSNR